jgi:Fur family transcriptional regulator, ferric uptake regulator
MKAIHRQEKDHLKKLFQQEHIDQFEDRYSIIEAFLRIEQHITVTELTEALASSGLSYSADFVRDTLKLMCRYGFAQKNSFDNGKVRYEHRHLGQHHDHMICTKCRNIVEFSNTQLEDLQVKIAAGTGFLMLQHKMEIYGICHECLKNRVDSLTLASAKQGERLVINDFSGGTVSRMRLLTMGLRIGDTIEVITNIGKGQVVIAIDGKRYVLGRGRAEKIMVHPLSSKQKATPAAGHGRGS